MLAGAEADSRRRHRAAARLLPQPDRHRSDAGAVAADRRGRPRAGAVAAGRLCLSRLWRRPGGRRRRPARAGPAGPGAARVQLVLEEFWPVWRAGRGADARRRRRRRGRSGRSAQVRISIRTNYSNPPTHGAAIVAAVLGDAGLRKQWEQELAAMRERIHQMRRLFVETMKAEGAAARLFVPGTTRRGCSRFPA